MQKQQLNEDKKKIDCLSKRLGFILESEYANFVDGNYQKVLSDLVLENESLKKDCQKLDTLYKNL